MTARKILANIINTGFMCSITATALDFFILRSNLDDSMRYGIAMGVDVVGYLTTGDFLAAGEKYIDDRTKTNS